MAITFHPDGRVEGAKLSQSGMVLQVQNVYRTNATDLTLNTTFQDVAGYQISITPRFANSKIVLTGTIPLRSLNVTCYGRFVRSIAGGADTVPSGWVGDADGGSNRVLSMFGNSYRTSGWSNLYSHSPTPVHAIDSDHNTTGTITYKLQFRNPTASHYVMYFGRNDNDGDTTGNTRSSGQLTAMEIAP